MCQVLILKSWHLIKYKIYQKPWTNYILGERVYDITFWKGELVTEMRLMDTEIDNLKVVFLDEPELCN